MKSPLDACRTGTEAHVIDEALGMDARHVQIVLPDEGEPLPADLRQRILDAVSGHISAHKIPQRELALAVSYDLSTVNEVLKAKYKGNTDGVLRAMAAFVEDDRRRRSGAKPAGYIDTTVCEAIRSAVHFCKSNALSASDLDKAATAEKPRIAIGYGPAGIGKTVGAKAYCLEDPRAIYIRLKGGAMRVPNIAADIVNAMTVRGVRKQRSAVVQCYEALRGSLRLLIVDEGHRMNFPVAEFLRDLSDVTGIPVLILCTQQFYARITRVRQRDGIYGYDQFTSRIGYVVDLLRGADGRGGEKRPYFSLDEIRAMFRRDQVRLSADGIEFMQALACTLGSGMLRVCATVFDKAARAAAKKTGVITLSLLQSSLDRSLVPAGLTDEVFMNRVQGVLAQNRGMNEQVERRAAAG